MSNSVRCRFSDCGEQYRAGECRFVPREAGTPGGDGWLAGVVTNGATGCGELVIADAQRLEEGQVARAHLPFAAAPQVHGFWAPAGSLHLPEEAVLTPTGERAKFISAIYRSTFPAERTDRSPPESGRQIAF